MKSRKRGAGMALVAAAVLTASLYATTGSASAASNFTYTTAVECKIVINNLPDYGVRIEALWESNGARTKTRALRLVIRTLHGGGNFNWANRAEVRLYVNGTVTNPNRAYFDPRGWDAFTPSTTWKDNSKSKMAAWAWASGRGHQCQADAARPRY
jgi:hypothetical protein